MSIFESFGNVARLSSAYPYEVVVFFIVLSIGIWPLADSSNLVKKVIPCSSRFLKTFENFKVF